MKKLVSFGVSTTIPFDDSVLNQYSTLLNNIPSCWPRWRRRYPSLEAWLITHPGEECGRALQTQEINYFMGKGWLGSHYGSKRQIVALWTTRRLCDWEEPNRITEAEFREWWGMPPRETNLPSNYLPRQPECWKTLSKAEAIKRIKKQMAKLGISLADLGKK